MESAALPPPLPGSQPEPVVAYRFSKPGFVLALVVIVTCVAIIVRLHSADRPDKMQEAGPNVVLELLARYAVGVHSMTGLKEVDAQVTYAILEDMKEIAKSDEDALRLSIVDGWLNNTRATGLDDMAAKSEALRRDVGTIRQFEAGQVDDETWKMFKKRHGWIASLARAKSEAEKQDITRQATGTAMVLIGGTMLGMCVVLGGMVMLILAILRWRGGKLRLTLRRNSGGDGGVLLEGFALYLALFLVVPSLMHHLWAGLPSWVIYAVLSSTLLVGMAWPRWRGMPGETWREALGLHRGEGWLREIGAGLGGWLASTPLLVAGMMAASWITKMTGQFPYHPIIDVFAGDIWAKLGAILLAAVWAPVSEELMFRGLLFPGLSAWVRWIPGTLAGAFVFAAIHPQGWAGVPAIMALAITFSVLRMWRRSVIAPMAAHALNNGLMCVLMLLLW